MPNQEHWEPGERQPVPTSKADKAQEQKPIYHEGDVRVDENGKKVRYSSSGGWKEVRESDSWL
jgi:hypothetical protein